MKKMSKQDVETVIFENAKTGEALEFQHEQHKAEYGAKHFWKADKKFFELLSTFSAAESKVVAYILQKTQPTKNEFIGAYKTIARKLECDVTTVRNTFKKMMENDMLAKTDDERIWMLNPRLLVKGDIIVKARLMSKYDSLLGRPLSDWIITDSNGNDPLFLPIEYGGLTPLWLSRETATRKRYLWTSFWRLKRSMTRSGKRVRMAKSRRRLRAKRKQYSYAAALMNL